MNNITFGNLLEKLLYVCNQKKTSLAKKLGYDISYINKWITSKNLPSSKRINEICANISTFIIDSLDEDTYSNMIEYLEVPFDSNEEFLQNYLEDLLKETYMDTLTSNNKSLLYFSTSSLAAFILLQGKKKKSLSLTSSTGILPLTIL